MYCIIINALVITCLVLALILIVGFLLTYPTNSPQPEDRLENIRVIGLEARQEMDRVCSGYMRQQVEHLLTGSTRTSHKDKRR